MLRARKLGVPTPVLYNADLESSCIVMENVLGESVKSVLKSRSLEPAGEVWGKGMRTAGEGYPQGKNMLLQCSTIPYLNGAFCLLQEL